MNGRKSKLLNGCITLQHMFNFDCIVLNNDKEVKMLLTGNQ